MLNANSSFNEKNISALLGSLVQEDYQTAVSFIEYLIAMRKKKEAQKSIAILSDIQATLGEDKGWESEAAMLEDMAQFRRERIGL